MNTKKKKAVVIGSGIGGLSTAALLAKDGYQVEVYEKNGLLGGRANLFKAEGFTFDMGPSWYLMPDVFQHFFDLMEEPLEKYLTLRKLQPSYRIFFKDENKKVDMYSDLDRDAATLEELEPGAGAKLREYLGLSKYQYDIAIKYFMYKNYDTVFDFFNRITMLEGRKLSVMMSMDKYVNKFFASDMVRKIMQYQLVFLGSSPFNTPALYNIMSHIDFNMGVYYPEGGIYSIVRALEKIGTKYGVHYKTNSPVKKIVVVGGKATGIELEDGQQITADLVVSNADIEHTDSTLLPTKSRTFSKRYWKSRTLAPSAFIMYLGVKGSLGDKVTHHNLIFCKDWKENFSQLFDSPQWPEDPSLYICCPSKTDASVAPAGHENLFVLVPIAPNLREDPVFLEEYADKILQTMEQEMGIPDLRQRIVYQRLYTGQNFVEDYNSYGGSALGLAHTLRQTAIFRPSNMSKKVKDLYYVGAGTNPGIGMPICLISSEMLVKRLRGDTSPSPLPVKQKSESDKHSRKPV